MDCCELRGYSVCLTDPLECRYSIKQAEVYIYKYILLCGCVVLVFINGASFLKV